MYKWIDSDGQTHLSDTPPPHTLATVVDMAGKRQDFNYVIKTDGVPLPLAFEGQIHAGSKRMYDSWHFFLGEDRLRQSQITLRLIANDGRYETLAAKAMPGGPPTGGFYNPVTNEAYVRYDERQPRRGIAVSFHEISHLITASHLGPTPPWLTEGLAVYFETMEVGGQRGTIRPNEAHLRRLRQSRLPKLADYLSQDRQQWYGGQRGLNYALAWSLMHFLMSGGDGLYALRAVIQQAHTNFCKPFSAAKALDGAYPGGLRRLEQDWRAWLSSDQPAVHQT